MPESKRRKPKNRPPSQKAIAAAKEKDPSPTWYVALIAGLKILGVVLDQVRFIFQMDQMVLVGGLGFIAVGFLLTTNYR